MSRILSRIPRPRDVWWWGFAALVSACVGRAPGADKDESRGSAAASGEVTAAPSSRSAAIPPEATHGSLRSDAARDLSTLPEGETQSGPKLLATARRTPIFAKPSTTANRIGYLRAGQTVGRSSEPLQGSGCRRGFYEIRPRGYVCDGVEATVDLEHPARQVNFGAPDVNAPLPYVYGLSRYPTPPLYTRVPSAAEQSRTEPLIERYLPRRDMGPWLALGVEEIPEFLVGHAPSYHVSGIRKGRRPLTSGSAFVESGFAFIRRFGVEGRYFGLTTDLEVLPLDRLDPVTLSEFSGVELGRDAELPVAFVRDRDAKLLVGQPDLGLAGGRPLGYRELVRLSGVKQVHGGNTYWQTRDGHWLLQTSRTTIVEPRPSFPDWTASGRTWLDVSLLRQTLVAYQGRTAKYVTLVSTGRDGIADAKNSHATVQGQFVIHTKHLTATMNGSGEGGAFDLREVPSVQYFSDGYALHAAYWHDSFGQPKSHGCINLSPRDARWLFEWTEPALPEGWHSVLAVAGGTWVTIHP